MAFVIDDIAVEGTVEAIAEVGKESTESIGEEILGDGIGDEELFSEGNMSPELSNDAGADNSEIFGDGIGDEELFSEGDISPELSNDAGADNSEILGDGIGDEELFSEGDISPELPNDAEVDNSERLGNDRDNGDPSTKAPDGPEDSRPDNTESKKTGGSYGELKSEGWGWNSEPPKEVHHMPSNESSPLETNDGPAIVMDQQDHRQTASCGNSRDAQEYRAKQKELIDQGKFDEALQMDIDDIHDKFGNKYDTQIKQMQDYIDVLKQNNKI